jgi:hypothetical protein
MCVHLYVLHILFGPVFHQNRDVATDFPKNPKYKGLRKFVWWESPCFIRTDGTTLGQKMYKKSKIAFRNSLQTPPEDIRFHCFCPLG